MQNSSDQYKNNSPFFTSINKGVEQGDNINLDKNGASKAA
jgi:hypothetical protein